MLHCEAPASTSASRVFSSSQKKTVGDDLVEEVEVASVDGFRELPQSGLGGFFAHCDLSLVLVEGRRFTGC
jgi:hypothetical protein